MRRQRPGSVERKIQEETVAIFGRLLFEYGKSIMEEIERKERELRQLMKNEMEQVGMIYLEKGVIWLIQNVSKWPFQTGRNLQLIDKIVRKCIFSPLQCNTMNVLLGHTAHFYQPMRPQAQEAKVERLERMKRSRSVPKLNQEGIEVLVS